MDAKRAFNATLQAAKEAEKAKDWAAAIEAYQLAAAKLSACESSTATVAAQAQLAKKLAHLEGKVGGENLAPPPPPAAAAHSKPPAPAPAPAPAPSTSSMSRLVDSFERLALGTTPTAAAGGGAGVGKWASLSGGVGGAGSRSAVASGGDGPDGAGWASVLRTAAVTGAASGGGAGGSMRGGNLKRAATGPPPASNRALEALAKAPSEPVADGLWRPIMRGVDGAPVNKLLDYQVEGLRWMWGLYPRPSIMSTLANGGA